MFILLGICILLAALLTFNSLASVCMVALWSIAQRFTGSCSVATRAGNLFLLRVLPVTLGLAGVVFFVGPAYLELEPRTTTETVSLKLAIVSLASAVGIGLAVIRGLAAWVATARLTNNWLAHGERVFLPRVEIPAYQIGHQFPVVAIVGILRPRLFLGRQIFDSLTPEEILAAVEHEAGHLVARDNLKRAVLRVCRDALLIIPCGRALDRAWAEASESAADEHAARRGRTVALDLASALVKISRMIPVGVGPAMPAGAFLIGHEGGPGIKARVRRLLQLASSDGKVERKERLVTNPRMWVSLAFLLSLLSIPPSNPHVLLKVHGLIEQLVAFLD